MRSESDSASSSDLFDSATPSESPSLPDPFANPNEQPVEIDVDDVDPPSPDLNAVTPSSQTNASATGRSNRSAGQLGIRAGTSSIVPASPDDASSIDVTANPMEDNADIVAIAIPTPLPETAVRPDQPSQELRVEETRDQRERRPSSWLFRSLRWTASAIEGCFGLISLVGVLAFATGLPVLQILTLGYILEATGRVGRSNRLRDGLPGIRRAARLGSIALGTFLCLLPLTYLSTLIHAGKLIDPSSPTVIGLGVARFVLTLMIVPHIVAAWFCGGRLRYFFWPLLAPYQLSVWMLRWTLATPVLRGALDSTLGRFWPTLVDDLCHVRPITDFFLPAILLKHVWQRTLYSHARDGFWNFVGGLHLWRLGRLGLQCLAGSLMWLFLPTLLLIGATALPDGPAVLSGFAGVVLLAIVAMYLPFLQAHFGTTGKMHSLFDVLAVFRVIRKSPFRATLAMILFLAAAIPLYAFKIEQIDPGLFWALSIFFVVFSLPARLVVAWAYARATSRTESSRWFWRWPVRVVAFPTALIFASFVSVTRFTSWGGAAGLFEQHAFLIPAPFLPWLGG